MDVKIGVLSELNVGSKFYFNIPLYEVIDSEIKEIEQYHEDKQENIYGNVLIVEDNKSDAELMIRTLKKNQLSNEIISILVSLFTDFLNALNF